MRASPSKDSSLGSLLLLIPKAHVSTAAEGDLCPVSVHPVAALSAASPSRCMVMIMSRTASPKNSSR